MGELACMPVGMIIVAACVVAAGMNFMSDLVKIVNIIAVVAVFLCVAALFGNTAAQEMLILVASTVGEIVRELLTGA